MQCHPSWWCVSGSEHQAIRAITYVSTAGAATNIMGNVSIDPIGYQTLAPYMSCMPGLIQPNDVAKAALFLATSSAINGAELTVDQGWLTA